MSKLIFGAALPKQIRRSLVNQTQTQRGHNTGAHVFNVCVAHKSPNLESTHRDILYRKLFLQKSTCTRSASNRVKLHPVNVTHTFTSRRIKAAEDSQVSQSETKKHSRTQRLLPIAPSGYSWFLAKRVLSCVAAVY